MALYEKVHRAVQRLPSKSNSSSAIQESLAFYANRNFIILFTTACHLFCPERNESSPQPPISLSHIVIASADISVPNYSVRFLLLKSPHQKPSIYTPSSSNVPHAPPISSSFISPLPPTNVFV